MSEAIYNLHKENLKKSNANSTSVIKKLTEIKRTPHEKNFDKTVK